MLDAHASLGTTRNDKRLCGAKKARVTAAYDADMVRWRRSLGHGYQARMNRVLRT